MGLFSKSKIDDKIMDVLETAENLLGKEVKEKVSGFRGIMTSYSRALYGCTQCCVVPPVDKDGKAVEGGWYDIGRLEIVGKGITKEEVADPDGGKGGENMSHHRTY